MATKKQTRTGDRSKRVMEALLARFKPYEQFHCESLKVEGLTPKQVSSSVYMLAKKGIVEHGALKGYYALPNGKATMNPAQAIYELLDFMAKAEAPLRRAAKILEAVEGAK